MLNHDIIAKIDMKSPSVWLATWFGCGLLKPAPGTWGTLGALPFGVALLYLGGWPVLLVMSAVVFAIGIYVSEVFDKIVGGHDSSAIVIDEVAGVWIALLPAFLTGPLYMTAFYVLLAFILFRFFDILKPWPIGWADKKLPGAWGVMMDDVLAGLISMVIIAGVRFAGFS